MTGKNTRTAAIIILASGLSTPNQLFMSGAKAMIGMAPAATASGSSASLADSQRAEANATATPATVPRMNPPTASIRVARADGQIENPSSQLFPRAVAIWLGFGRRNDLTPIAVSASSQVPMTTTNTIAGATRSPAIRRARP